MQYAPARELLHFIKNSPTCYHVTENIRQKLLANGYTELSERERWEAAPGGKYFVRRNGSSTIAFRVPEMIDGGFAMAAAHSDSPAFRLKEHPDRRSAHYVQLSTEKYGGMLMSTWFDRPLSVAGRVFVRANGEIVEKLVSVDRDLLVIPNVAIHMNRTANDGMKYLANIDTLPLLGGKDSGGILPIVAKAADVAENDILGSDLFLYCRGEGTLLGENEEYILSPKLDDLECACGCLEGFLAAKESGNIAVCCIFDNEEVGSSTKQGAGSTFLRDTLRRIALCLGKDEQELQMMLARSFLVSADNAHAQHPNHGEYADPDNCPYMNEGVVIKFNANQRYATDGRSCAIVRAVCENAGVPVSVMASGMGMPSIGIYSYELFTQYDVESIIRVGSAGALQKDLKLGDVVAGMGACTNSNYAAQYGLGGTFAPIADFQLLSAAVESAKELGVRMDVGNLYSSDTFYDASNPSLKWADMGVLAIEMEAAALYCNAAYTKKRGLSLCSISDNILTGEELSPEARQTSFTAMMKIALETAVKMAAESKK